MVQIIWLILVELAAVILVSTSLIEILICEILEFMLGGKEDGKTKK